MGFALKGPPKLVFWVILGVGAKIFGGKVYPSLELHVFRHLWSSSPTRSRRKTALPESTPLDLQLPHGKIVIILRCNPWAVGWSPEGTFLGLCMGKIDQNPKTEQL